MTEQNAPAPPTIRLDIHTHLIPVQEGCLAESEGVIWDAGKSSLRVDGVPIALASLFRPCDLLAWMQTQGVAEAWISIPPPLYRQHLSAPAARDWAQRLNHGLCALAQAHAALAPLLHLPVEHPETATELASVWIRQGFRRFAMATGCHGRTLSDKAYDPLWHTLDEGRAFLFLHPGDSPDPRLEPFYLGNLLGNPYETSLAAAHLALAGIPARYPDLKICLAHCGGLIALLEARLTRGFDTARPGIDPALESPREAIGRLFVDAILHRPDALSFAAEAFGPNHILFGSDWPFPMGLPNPHEQLCALPTGLRQEIFSAHPDVRHSNERTGSIGAAKTATLVETAEKRGNAEA